MQLFKMQNENNFEGYWQYFPYYKNIIPQLQKEVSVKDRGLYREVFVSMLR